MLTHNLFGNTRFRDLTAPAFRGNRLARALRRHRQCRVVVGLGFGRTIAGWRIDPLTGRLASRRITPCPVGLRCFDIDLWSRFLVIGGVDSDKAPGAHDSPEIACFAIDPTTGALTERGRAHCADGLYWVEIVGFSGHQRFSGKVGL